MQFIGKRVPILRAPAALKFPTKNPRMPRCVPILPQHSYSNSYRLMFELIFEHQLIRRRTTVKSSGPPPPPSGSPAPPLPPPPRTDENTTRTWRSPRNRVINLTYPTFHWLSTFSSSRGRSETRRRGAFRSDKKTHALRIASFGDVVIALWDRSGRFLFRCTPVRETCVCRCGGSLP